MSYKEEEEEGKEPEFMGSESEIPTDEELLAFEGEDDYGGDDPEDRFR